MFVLGLARASFCVCFSVFQVHMLLYFFVLIVCTSAIDCLKKTRLWNDLLRAEWDIKPLLPLLMLVLLILLPCMKSNIAVH